MLVDVGLVRLRLVVNKVCSELSGLVPKIVVEFPLHVPKERDTQPAGDGGPLRRLSLSVVAARALAADR